MFALTLVLLGWLTPTRHPAAVGGSRAESPLPDLSALTVVPTSVIGGTRATATVTLSEPAPPGGFKVSVASNHVAAKLVDVNGTAIEAVLVRERQTAAQVVVITSPVPVGDTVRAVIAAFTSGARRIATLTILPPAVRTIAVAPASLTGGASSTATVTLTGPAPNGGASIAILATGNASGVSHPAGIAIPAGQTTGQFPVTTTPVTAQVQRTLMAVAVRPSSGPTLVGGSPSSGATLTVMPPVLNTFTAFPPTTNGVANVTITLQLTGPTTPSGLPVALSSSHPDLIAVPPSVMINAGQSGRTLTTQTRSPNQEVTVTLRANAGGVERTATVVVRPPL